MQTNPKYQPVEHKLDVTGLSDVSFGVEMKKQFYLDDKVAFVNHGSYGTVPKVVLDLQHEYNIERETFPDQWFKVRARKYLAKATEAVAKFVNSDADNVVFVPNATTGLNTVVKAYPWKKGDAVLDTTLTYGAISILCNDLTTRINPDVKKLSLKYEFPITSERETVDKFEEMLKSHPNIKMAIVDHITSPTSIVMPVKQLGAVCRKYQVLCVVDGAHSIGQLKIDMQDLDVDCYVSNLHKWLYTPRGTAFVWFSKSSESWLRPLVTSWHSGFPLIEDFFDQGTRDHVPNICALHGLEFVEAIGGFDKITSYTSNLATEVKKLFKAELGFEPLAIPEAMEAPNMRLIKLPKLKDYPASEEGVWALQDAIFGNSSMYGVFSPVQGDIYIRYSVQIYNNLQEFKNLILLIKEFFDKNEA